MPYEFNRTKLIEEEIKLGEEVITIKVNPFNIADKAISQYNKIKNTQNKIDELKLENNFNELEKTVENLGNQVYNFFILLFEKEASDKIISFYEGNYIEMICEIFPFITNNLLVKISEAIKQKQQDTKLKYTNKK